MQCANRPNTIFLLDPSHSFTGAFAGSQRIAELLAADCNCHLLLSQTANIDTKHLAAFDTLHRIPLRHLSRRRSDLLGYFPSLLRASWGIRRRMRQHHCSTLILNDFYLMHGVILRLLGFRGTIITYARANPKHLVGRIAAPMLWLIGRTSNHVVTVSRYIQNLLPPSLQTTLIYDAMNAEPSHPAPRRIWQRTDAKIILFIGNYIEGKGQNVALEAFAQVAASDTSLSLHFYGSDMGLEKNSAYREALIQRTETLGLTGRVQFNGFAEDTAPLLHEAFAALNASASESFSLTVLEACASGVPVIATASGGPQEIIIDGQTGYLVSVGDADAIAKRLSELAANPDHAAALGFAAKAHVAEQFSPERQREQLLALLGLNHQP